MSEPAAPLVADPTGSGPPLVALHASGMSSRQFARFTRDASDRFRVHAADLLGVGRTPMPRGPYALEGEVQALLALLRSLDAPAFIYAHSYGGLVALEAAVRAPERVRALALFEPVLFRLLHGCGDAEAEDQLRALDGFMDGLRGAGMSVWIEQFIDWWNGPGFYRTLPAPTQAQYLGTAPEAARQAGAVRESGLSLGALRSFDVPTLFFSAERSPTAARRCVALAAAAMPRATLRDLAGAGHMAPLTHPAVVHPAVLGFFDAQDGSLGRID